MSYPCGSNIDVDSKMRMGGVQTNPRERISLYTRPFATVPYMGRGPARPIKESTLQQGDFVTNRKSVNSLMEKSFIDNRFTPMLPSLQETVTNPRNLVEGVASDGWIRGGLPTRELIRQQDQSRYR